MRENILPRQRVIPKKLHYQTEKPFLQGTKEQADEIHRETLLKKVEVWKQKYTRKIVKFEAKLGASNSLKQRVNAGTKSLSSDIGKKLIDEGIKHVPFLYRLGTSKIKNKNVRKALESDAVDYIAEKMQQRAKEDLNNLFREL